MYTLLIVFSLSLGSSVSTASTHSFVEDCKGELQNNQRQGAWKCYYDNGVLLQEGEYKAGKKEGTWKLYHVNGILAGEGNYLNDAEKGKWKFYDDNGKLIIEQDY